MKKQLFILALLLVSGGVALAETNFFTTSVTDISDSKATLNVAVQGCCNGGDDNMITEYYFEYGTTTSVSKRTDKVRLDWHSGNGEETINEPFATAKATIQGLRADTKYYYRFIQRAAEANEADEYEDSDYTYTKSELRSFRTINEGEELGGQLTEAQEKGLEDLGFTPRQINMIVTLFEKSENPGPQGLACGYRHHLTLRHGMSGEDIREMQKALKLTADGKFGRMTKEAVMRFQAEHGLPADGVIGPKTGLKLGLLCHTN